jgi:hypothetical protein
MSIKLAAVKGRVLAMSVVCALLAGTTIATAQVYRDDPPGSAFEDRGIDEDNGLAPGEHWSGQGGYQSGYGAHASGRGARGAQQQQYGDQGFGSSQWSSAQRDHGNQCWYREGGGGQDLSGYWGPCATH